MKQKEAFWLSMGISIISVLHVGILSRLFWNLAVFCDEYNFSPYVVYGGSVGPVLSWIRLLGALVLLLCGIGLLFGASLERVVLVLGIVVLGISLQLAGSLLLFCHEQGVALTLVCGSTLDLGLFWLQLLAALSLLLCGLWLTVSKGTRRARL